MAWLKLLLPFLALTSSVPQVYANPVSSYSAGAGNYQSIPSPPPPPPPPAGSVQPSPESQPAPAPPPGAPPPGPGQPPACSAPPSGPQPGSGPYGSGPGSDHDHGAPFLSYPSHTKEFWLTVTWEDGAPDGFTRKLYRINGQTPGPVIECEQGDDVIVHVINESPNDISMHWHGIEQRYTAYSDGVPGISQLPIKSGDNFIYSFKATQYGAYAYHGHDRNQIEDGLTGAVIIHPHDNAPRPFFMIDNSTEAIEAMIRAEREAKPLVISDWNHLTSTEKQAVTVNAEMEVTCYHSVLFNGKGRVNCPDVDKITPLAMPGLKTILDLIPGSTLTDFACVPAANMIAFGGGGNLSAVPPGLFSGCKATDTDLEYITVGKDQWVALHIIHIASFITPLFSIDGHEIWVFSVDGAYITPQKINAAPLYNAQRIGIMFKTFKAGKFEISIKNFAAIQMLKGSAVLEVQGENGTSLADTQAYVDDGGNPVSKDVIVFNDSIAYPFPSSPVQPGDVLFKLNMTLATTFNWGLNYTPMDVPKVEDAPRPVLYGGPSPNTHDNLTITTYFNQWVDICFFSQLPLPHSLHKHSNKMYVTGKGTGNFPWDSVEEAAKAQPESFNLVNPPMRDTFPSLPAPAPGMTAWTCARYPVINPGPFLLHCHIGTHFMNGMAIIMRDAEDMWPKPPRYYELKANGTDVVG